MLQTRFMLLNKYCASNPQFVVKFYDDSDLINGLKLGPASKLNTGFKLDLASNHYYVIKACPASNY